MDDVTPGEPLPPGFEDEEIKETHIQDTLDQYKGNSLIGIEYTVELHESDRPEPGYLCVMCDKRGDARTIIHHWCSFNHRMKYLEKHFPTAVREFQPVKYKPNSHNYLILIVQSLAEAIEDFHGRLKVKAMDADEFRRQKTKHTEEIMSTFHHDEKNGPNFLNAIDRSLFDQNSTYKGKQAPADVNDQKKGQKRFSNAPNAGSKSAPKKDEFDAISSDSDNPDSAKKPKLNNRPMSAKAPYQQDERKDEQGKKLPTPKELSMQASHIAQERYKREKYRCMLEINLKQMETLQKDYEKSPEKHPQYPEEWKKFWNRRYKELQAEKKVDPNKHDYKPEWIIFWTKRMKELFNAEVEKKKEEIKVKLGLPEETEEKVDQLKERYKIPVNRIQRPQVTDVIDISDDESPNGGRRGRPRRSRTRSPQRGNRGRDYRRRTRSRSKSRSLSPFSDDYEMSKHRHLQKSHRSAGSRAYNPIETKTEYYPYGSSRYPPIPHGNNHYPSHSSSGPYRVLDSSKIPKYEDSNTKDSKEEEPKEEEGPLTVVGVLRLLTALEDHLGSLGPKVVDLLGKALALEKVKANSSDDLLLNEDNSVFFETIKEKLKGLLIADVLDDPHKVRAVKKAVKNIAGVIHQVSKGRSTGDGPDDKGKDGGGASSIITATHAKRKANNSNNSNNNTNIKDLPFDRQMVATKMAAALVMQGREDVSTEDMDKLIYFFLLMVKLSKPKRELDDKPVYCKNILPELGIMPTVSATTAAALAALPGLVEGLLDNDIASLVQAVDNDFENDVPEKEVPKNDTNSSTLESLTDSDLQTLLQNFKHLSSEEQHHLIAHLKKLESVDPERVEKLRKYVNTSDSAEPAVAAGTSKSSGNADGSHSKTFQPSEDNTNYNSPISASGSKNEKRDRAPGTEEDERTRASVNPNKFSLDDDDDDDYNFDEVFKAASKNVNSRTPDETSRHSTDVKSSKSSNDQVVGVLSSQNDLTFNPAGLKDPLSDTQNLIANLMGSLQQSNSKSKNGASKSIPPNIPQPQPVPPVGANHQPPGQGHHMPPQPNQQQHNMAFYQQQHQQPQPQHHQQQQQQQQQQGYPDMQQNAYNQMAPNAAHPNYYNQMGAYNQNPYAGYQQQWGPGQQQMPPHNMQGQFGMQHNYPMPNQGGGYNMYGQGGN